MQDFTVKIYNIPDGSYLTSFTHPLSKRKVRKAFTQREDAKVYKEEMEQKYKRKKKAHYLELNLEELIIIFIQEKPGNVFSKSKMHILDFIETFGKFKINELTHDALKIWLDQVQEEHGLRDITVRGLKCEIDTLFAFLIEKDIISESPLQYIRYKKYVPSLKLRNILSEEKIDELLGEVKKYSPGYLYPIILMFAETAAKNKEIIDLAWKDVSLDKGEIFFKQNKAAKERTIKISDELVSLLKAKQYKRGQVFWTYYKEPFTSCKLHYAITEFKKKNLYKDDWTPLDLRHSFAVNFLAKGGDMRELQRILGHGQVSDTRKLYGEAATIKTAKTVTNPFKYVH